MPLPVTDTTHPSQFFDQASHLPVSEVSSAGKLTPVRTQSDISGFLANFGSDQATNTGDDPAPGESPSAGQDDLGDLPITAASGLGGDLPAELAGEGPAELDYLTPPEIWADANELSEIQESDFAGRSQDNSRSVLEAGGDPAEVENAPANNTGGGGNNAGHGNGGFEIHAGGGVPAVGGGAPAVGGTWCNTFLNVAGTLTVLGILTGIGFLIAENVTGVPPEDSDTPYYPSNLEVQDQGFAPFATAPDVRIDEPGLHELTSIRALLQGWILHAAPDSSAAPEVFDGLQAQDLTLIGSPSPVFTA